MKYKHFIGYLQSQLAEYHLLKMVLSNFLKSSNVEKDEFNERIIYTYL